MHVCRDLVAVTSTQFLCDQLPNKIGCRGQRNESHGVGKCNNLRLDVVVCCCLFDDRCFSCSTLLPLAVVVAASRRLGPRRMLPRFSPIPASTGHVEKGRLVVRTHQLEGLYNPIPSLQRCAKRFLDPWPLCCRRRLWLWNRPHQTAPPQPEVLASFVWSAVFGVCFSERLALGSGAKCCAQATTRRQVEEAVAVEPLAGGPTCVSCGLHSAV